MISEKKHNSVAGKTIAQAARRNLIDSILYNAGEEKSQLPPLHYLYMLSDRRKDCTMQKK